MTTIEKKIFSLKGKFALLPSAEARYLFLIDLGRALPPYPENLKTAEHRVAGCQSTLYLSSQLENGVLVFQADADALISKGLAALMIAVYSGETPETIVKIPPNFLAELGILGALSPSRSNGLAHIHKRMRDDTLKNLL